MSDQISKVLEELDSTGYTSFWMWKDEVKNLKKIVKEKHPGASIVKLSGTEQLFIFISLGRNN